MLLASAEAPWTAAAAAVDELPESVVAPLLPLKTLESRQK